MIKRLVGEKKLAGAFLRGDEEVDVQVSLALHYFARPEEPPTQREALLEMGLLLPDESYFHVIGLFTKRGLTEAAAALEEVANGTRTTAYVTDTDLIYLHLQMDAPVSSGLVSVRGEFDKPEEDTNIGLGWAALIGRRPRSSREPEWTMQDLLLSRKDVAEFAAMIRDFLRDIGWALPEPSAYDA